MRKSGFISGINDDGVIELYRPAYADRTLSGAIYSNQFGQIRILKVERQNPLILEIQATTDRWLGIGPCKDVSVIVYDDASGDMITSAVAKTSSFAGCTGTARLVFPQNFNPNSLVKLQIIGGTNPDTLANHWSGRYTSNPIRLSNHSGIISTPHQPGIGPALTGGLDRIDKTVRNLTIAAVVVTGIYLLYPTMPFLQQEVSRRTQKAASKRKETE